MAAEWEGEIATLVVDRGMGSDSFSLEKTDNLVLGWS